MNPKKQLSSRDIAATHFLLGGLVAPLIGGSIIFFTVPLHQLDIVTLGGIIVVADALLVYVGTMFSSRYINKTYLIPNSQSIVNLSTIYMVVLYSIYYIYVVKTNVNAFTDPGMILDVAQKIVMVIVFYFVSKKFIKVS